MGVDNRDVFHFVNELEDIVSKIISEKENEDYVCERLEFKLPRRKELVFESPSQQLRDCPYGGPSLQGGYLNYLDEKYGENNLRLVPEETLAYQVVAKRDLLKILRNGKYVNYKELNDALESSTVYYGKFGKDDDFYRISIRSMQDKFPYLNEFFNNLNKLELFKNLCGVRFSNLEMCNLAYEKTFVSKDLNFYKIAEQKQIENYKRKFENRSSQSKQDNQSSQNDELSVEAVPGPPIKISREEYNRMMAENVNRDQLPKKMKHLFNGINDETKLSEDEEQVL